jgi:hypothetical protein
VKKQLLCCTSAAVVLLLYIPASSRQISGISVIKLTSPITQEIKDNSLTLATGYFRTDCIEWLKEETGITVDTANAVWKYHLSAFTDKCIKAAKQESSLKDHDWTVSIVLPSEDAQTVLKEYNSACQAQSIKTWTNFKNSLETDNKSVFFPLGIQSIFFSMGRLEKTLDVPGSDEPGAFLVDDARKIMQNFINKLTIRANSFVISGKAGSTLAEPFVIKVMHDTAPVPNMNIIGTTPSGKTMFKGTTDSSGTVTINGLEIPFVSKGTFLYIQPDFGSMVNGLCYFSASDIGIKFPEQTFLFNTVSPTFSIDYKVTAVSDINIPKDFSGDAFIKKFLRDSCFLIQASSPEKSDMRFKVITQVSSYSSDSTEKTTYKVENSVTILDAAGKTLAEKTALVLEKSYETNSNYSLGLFFWEAASKSYHMLRAMLDDM